MPSLSAFSMRFAFESVNKLHSFYFSTLVLCIAHFLYYSKLMTNAHSNYAMKRLMAAHCESNRECFCCINGKARIRLEKSRKQIANEKEVKPITYHAEREPERERNVKRRLIHFLPANMNCFDGFASHGSGNAKYWIFSLYRITTYLSLAHNRCIYEWNDWMR